jgi:competence protein ComEA
LSFKEQIKEYFDFNRGERKGILVLIGILLCVIVINFSIEIIPREDFSEKSQLKLNEFIEFQNESRPFYSKHENSDYLNYDTLDLFLFNPNISSDEEFKQLGLTDKQTRTIKNYLSKGGSFKYKSDFKKIYGITNYQFQKLYPYINLPEKQTSSYKYSDLDYDSESSRKETTLFYFDPNTISDKEWMSLGFSEKQTQSIRKYIQKGGKFKNKEDIKKLYVVSDEKYAELEKYINIVNIENEISETEELVSVIDLNNFTVNEFKYLGEEWQNVASRIVKFRNLLGGFANKEQLKDVYGLKLSLYVSVKEKLYIDKSKINQININFAENSELSKHPYLSYEEAKEITQYRNKKGAYKSVEELREKSILSAETYKKIAPYLCVE